MTGGADTLSVGAHGTGTLTVDNGGTVYSGVGYIGLLGRSIGATMVTGTGSSWTNTPSLYVGSYGNGTLTVADGGKVTAASLGIYSTSVVNLQINGSDMLVLGTDATAGSVSNEGNINLSADAFLASGTYKPISDLSNRTMTWSGAGTYNALGGSWDDTAKTFSVGAATVVAAGIADTLTTGERLTISDGGGNNRVGASFGAVPVGSTFAASLMTPGELSLLALDAGEAVLSAWDITTNLTGSTVLLSFDVGPGASTLEAWHYTGGAWTLLATDVTYRDGSASFTVDSLSGYAVTAAVPEPMGMTLLALAGMGLLRRRERRTALA